MFLLSGAILKPMNTTIDTSHSDAATLRITTTSGTIYRYNTATCALARLSERPIIKAEDIILDGGVRSVIEPCRAPQVGRPWAFLVSQDLRPVTTSAVISIEEDYR